MKILFVCQSASHHKLRPFGQGGSDSQIYGLASALSNKGHHTDIVGKFIEPGWRDPSVDIHHSGMDFINVSSPSFPDQRFGNLASGLLLSKQIAEKIDDINPDAIIIAAPFTGFFISSVDLPTMYVTHNPTGMDFFREYSLENHWLNNLAFPLIRGLEERILNRTDRIIALNTSIKEYMQKKGFKNVCFVPNGVNPAFYSSAEDGNYILYAGGFRRVKGVEHLVTAFSKIAESYNTELILIGTGREEGRLRKLVSALNLENRVRFIPLVDKITLRDYLSKCSIFVLPSSFEMMPVTLLEAMASGRTVIASDIPGPRDIITHGYDGFLVKNAGPDQLAGYIDLCLSDAELRERTGKNARDTIQNRFTFDSLADQYLEIIEEVIKNK